MPSQTYFNWMTNIKNQYLCVAKTQVNNPNRSWWLILVGTDALESLFGQVHTMIGADSNADIKQLANHIESAALCNQILAENPHWECGPCRLAMKTWRDEAGDISTKLDHINLASWRSNVAVKSMVLLTCWENGCSMTVRELKALGYPTPFEDMDKGEGFDMFCPFRNNNMVLLGTPTEGECKEDKEEIAMATAM